MVDKALSSQTFVPSSPLDAVIEAAERRNGPCNVRGIYHITNCPGPNHLHGDSNPSLHFWETTDDNNRSNVAFKCHSGNCTRSEIIKGFGLSSALIPGIPSLSNPKKPVITLHDVAEHTMIDWQILFNLGVQDVVTTFHTKEGRSYKERGVKIPYYLPDGTEYERYKIRLALQKSDEQKSPRWKWSEGDGDAIAYGLQHLQKAIEAGYLVIVEGESDHWTLYFHGFPSLGIPGANSVQKALDAALLMSIPRIYVIQEKTDQAGIHFPYAVQLRLREQGYAGEILRVPLKTATGAKDPNELHKQLYARMQEEKSGNPFKVAFQRALDQAKPMSEDTGYQPYQVKMHPATTITTLEEIDPKFVLDCLAQAEWGDSLLFAKLFQGKALYDHTSEEWYLWHDHYWELDESHQIKHHVSGHLASVYLKAGAALNMQVRGDEASEDEDVKARVAKLKEQIKTLTERAFKLRGVSRNRNVLSFAASQPGMSVTAKQWDRNPWLLALPNGVLDLQTGELRDGRPDDYIRTVCPTEWRGLYEPAPRWERFLDEIFEDREPEVRRKLISFLQRLLGYGITGDVSEHIFAVFYGEMGRNGKDTIQRAISHTLGNVSGAIEKDVLLDAGRQKAAGGASPHLMDLQGKRLAWANEPEKGARFNVGQVKDLSGGGDIPARGLFEKKITKIKPSHLLILLSNHKPHADPNDTAFWTRLRFISFNMRFVNDPQDTNERKIDTGLWKALENEAAGILAWLVRGCLDWQTEGLNTPQSVINDGNEYREEEDEIKLFLDQCCIVKQDATVKASSLYKAYSKWCEDGNMYRLNLTNFGSMLKKKKFEKSKTMHGVIYSGLGLLVSEDDEQSMNSSKKVFMPYESAPQAASLAIASSTHEQYEQCKQKVAITSPREGSNYELSVNSIHTVHAPTFESTTNQHLEPSEDTMNSSNEVFIAEKQNELRTLWERLKTLPIVGPLGYTVWTVPDNDFTRGNVSKAEYLERLAKMIKSGDPLKMRAAEEEMKKRLGA